LVVAVAVPIMVQVFRVLLEDQEAALDQQILQFQVAQELLDRVTLAVIITLADLMLLAVGAVLVQWEVQQLDQLQVAAVQG
jgi:hypothetical protein